MSDPCDRYRKRLLAFAEGELDLGEAAELTVHLERCPSCREAVRAWRADRPRFGEVRMPPTFWAQREQELLTAALPRRPGWRRFIDAVVAPVPVPRVVAFAAMLTLAWLAGLAGHEGAAPLASPSGTAPPRPAARPLYQVDGLSSLSANLG